MPTFIDRAPIPGQPTWFDIGSERISLRDNQIIHWAVLTRKHIARPAPTATPFPVILDTGFTHSFALNEHHLGNWAGLQIDTFPALGSIRDRGSRIPLHVANLWVYPNQRGSRVRLANRVCHQLETDFGIAVYPGNSFPRIPILGLRSITKNQLRLTIDGKR